MSPGWSEAPAVSRVECQGNCRPTKKLISGLQRFNALLPLPENSRDCNQTSSWNLPLPSPLLSFFHFSHFHSETRHLTKKAILMWGWKRRQADKSCQFFTTNEHWEVGRGNRNLFFGPKGSNLHTKMIFISAYISQETYSHRYQERVIFCDAFSLAGVQVIFG